MRLNGNASKLVLSNKELAQIKRLEKVKDNILPILAYVMCATSLVQEL